MLQDILLTQQRELADRLKEPYVERKIVCPWGLDDDLIKVIAGPRRSGKSFYGLHLIQQARPYGYVNFDDERLAGIGDYDEILSAANAVYGNPRYLLFKLHRSNCLIF
jgi:predicted AAA+ superfamily ATPase